MDELPRPLPDVMQPATLEELYRAKEERRARLAALPLTEKVRLMEKLQAAGRTLRAARVGLSGAVEARTSSQRDE